jgi:hypothetical protein
MSHGSKKFIEAYDGKLKRSNDLTKKDYYRDLAWWDEYYIYRYSRFLKQRNMKNFCPQCKHVQKPIRAEEDAWEERNDELHTRYNAKHGVAAREWKEWRQRWWRQYRLVQYADRVTGKITEKEVPNELPPKMPEPPTFYEWVHKNYGPNAHYPSWHYHARSYLCYKCETKYDKKRAMWHDGHPGCKRNYTYMRRQDYRDYRAEVKNIMRKARYDEDMYENIPAYRKAWLD